MMFNPVGVAGHRCAVGHGFHPRLLTLKPFGLAVFQFLAIEEIYYNQKNFTDPYYPYSKTYPAIIQNFRNSFLS